MPFKQEKKSETEQIREPEQEFGMLSWIDHLKVLIAIGLKGSVDLSNRIHVLPGQEQVTLVGNCHDSESFLTVHAMTRTHKMY